MIERRMFFDTKEQAERFVKRLGYIGMGRDAYVYGLTVYVSCRNSSEDAMVEEEFWKLYNEG